MFKLMHTKIFTFLCPDYFRNFPRPDLGPNIGPFPIKKMSITSQKGVYHSQFLSSTFGENFMKI